MGDSRKYANTLSPVMSIFISQLDTPVPQIIVTEVALQRGNKLQVD